jgi:uncharacterized protein (DUF433 family)
MVPLASLTPTSSATISFKRRPFPTNAPGDAFPGIESTPGVCGGEPGIVRTRIPVWALVQARQLGMSEAELLRAYPSLRAEDLVNAWAYYRSSYREEIEQQIREHEAA